MTLDVRVGVVEREAGNQPVGWRWSIAPPPPMVVLNCCPTPLIVQEPVDSSMFSTNKSCSTTPNRRQFFVDSAVVVVGRTQTKPGRLFVTDIYCCCHPPFVARPDPQDQFVSRSVICRQFSTVLGSVDRFWEFC